MVNRSTTNIVLFCKRTARKGSVYPRCISTITAKKFTEKTDSRVKISTVPIQSLYRKIHLSSSNLARKDYYKILNISRNATQGEIKKAYYQLAKKYHPDTNKGDRSSQEKFAEVAEAYEVLSDANKRQQYDIHGNSGFSAGQTSWPGGGFSGQSIDPEELFRKIFNDFQSQSDTFQDFREYAPVEVVMDLSFFEAARGAKKTMTLELMDSCPRCDGHGNEPGTKIAKCGYCGGTGMEQIISGPFVMRSTCRKCGGSGKFITSPCTMCGSRGQMSQMKTITIPVPAGVESNQTMRTQAGAKEIYVTFKVAPSPLFKRAGFDVYSDMKVSIAQAILGGSLQVPGIHEDILVKIPELTSSHRVFKFPGKGIRKLNSYGHGDHYVHTRIQMPKSLTDRQRELISNFVAVDDELNFDSHGEDANPDTHKSSSSKNSPSTEDEQRHEATAEKNDTWWTRLKKFFTRD